MGPNKSAHTDTAYAHQVVCTRHLPTQTPLTHHYPRSLTARGSQGLGKTAQKKSLYRGGVCVSVCVCANCEMPPRIPSVHRAQWREGVRVRGLMDGWVEGRASGGRAMGVSASARAHRACHHPRGAPNTQQAHPRPPFPHKLPLASPHPHTPTRTRASPTQPGGPSSTETSPHIPGWDCNSGSRFSSHHPHRAGGERHRVGGRSGKLTLTRPPRPPPLLGPLPDPRTHTTLPPFPYIPAAFSDHVHTQHSPPLA